MKTPAERMVLFVCVENTFRSIMSEAIFNAHAPEGWYAESAGVQPAEAINPIAVELLHEIGIEVGPKTSRLVSSELTARAWRVITFGCLDRCPIGAKEKSEDWPIPGAGGHSSTGGKDAPLKSVEELHAIRAALERRILGLIEEIKRSD
jgi:arsenate reductase